jgi:uncharacterized membrane protein
MRILWVFAIPVGSVVGAYLFYGSGEDWFVPVFLAGFFVLGIFASVEAVTNFLILDAHELRFRKSFRSVQIARTEIELATCLRYIAVLLCMIQDPQFSGNIALRFSIHCSRPPFQL